MPLLGVPSRINPELLYQLARMGHGDRVCIADGNFPSDSVAMNCAKKEPIRVMDRMPQDKDRNLAVPAYDLLSAAADITASELEYVERFEFYQRAKDCFVVVQTDDSAIYANVIITKGVISAAY